MFVKFLNKLSVKLIFAISGVVLIFLGFYTFFSISNLKNQLTLTSAQNAYNISDMIKKSTRYSMLLNRNEDIFQIIRTIGTESGVYKIRIYDKTGHIAFSSDSSEIGRSVNMDIEECNICHSKKEIPANLTWKNMIRFYEISKGQRLLSLINPIQNEKDCYTSGCHAHEQNKAVLGVLDVIIKTDKIDEIIYANTKDIIISSILLTILIAAFCVLFINFIVNRPLKEIFKGIQELAAGNLNYKISIRSKDELGKTASQFNEMSSKLDSAYTEIKEWSETLNQKVEDKNEELKKIYEQIIQIEKLASLGKLSATVAHELNNPLEGILTYSKLIAKKISQKNESGQYDDIIKFLNLIADESSRCGNIVKNLLFFSNQQEGQFSESNIVEIIEKSLTLINHHLEINKLKLIKNYSQDTLFIYCDSQKIEQALIAIFINAVESMPEGGTLTVELTKEISSVIIRISDTGKGINEKDLPHIFEPFYSTKKEIKGTGLGLSVTYGIIMQHKGKVLVEKTSQSGTTFKVSLPITNET